MSCNNYIVTRTYSEMIALPSYAERLNYLKVNSQMFTETFGAERYINQKFYRSEEWKRIRRDVVMRDNGCDLADPMYPIGGRIIIHHMNPLSLNDIRDRTDYLLNPEYLVCVSKQTHDAIHYGLEIEQQEEYVPRRPNDTCPWKGEQNESKQKQQSTVQYNVRQSHGRKGRVLIEQNAY